MHRQYTGTAGKTTNCQLAPSLMLCTRTSEVPVDIDLYIPQSWADDATRCAEARIPDEVRFRAKWQIGLDMVRRAVDAGDPPGLLLADSACGDVGGVRAGVRELGPDYALDVKAHTRVRIVCSNSSESEAMTMATVADVIGRRALRSVTWRDGAKRAPSAGRPQADGSLRRAA